MFARILFPTDLSMDDERLWPLVAETAKAFSAGLHVLHVIEPVYGELGLDPVYRVLQSRSQEVLARLAGYFEDAGVRCTTAVMIGKRRRAIADIAERENVDLIVIGARSDPRDPESLGPTSEKLAAIANRCVLLLREQREQPEARGESGVPLGVWDRRSTDRRHTWEIESTE